LNTVPFTQTKLREDGTLRNHSGEQFTTSLSTVSQQFPISTESEFEGRMALSDEFGGEGRTVLVVGSSFPQDEWGDKVGRSAAFLILTSTLTSASTATSGGMFLG
jgi:hypothetical protein